MEPLYYVRLSSIAPKDALDVNAKDFELTIGGSVLRCNRVQAAFLSPAVCELLRTDPTACSLVVSLNSSSRSKLNVTKNLIGNLISLSEGDRILVTPDNFGFLIAVGKVIGNGEIVESLMHLVEEQTPLDSSNVFERLLLKSSVNMSMLSEIEFIAKHFSEFEAAKLSNLSFEVLEDVLSSEHLRLQNEDSLLTFIKDLGP
jgi:hypothetical protein